MWCFHWPPSGSAGDCEKSPYPTPVSLSCGNVDWVLPHLSSFREKPEFLQKISRFYNVTCYIQITKTTIYANALGQTKGAACYACPVPCCSEECQLAVGTKGRRSEVSEAGLRLKLEKGNIKQLLRDIKGRWRKSSKGERTFRDCKEKARFLKSERSDLDKGTAFSTYPLPSRILAVSQTVL